MVELLRDTNKLNFEFNLVQTRKYLSCFFYWLAYVLSFKLFSNILMFRKKRDEEILYLLNFTCKHHTVQWPENRQHKLSGAN